MLHLHVKSLFAPVIAILSARRLAVPARRHEVLLLGMVAFGLTLIASAARADIRFNTGVPSMAGTLTITAYDANGTAFPLVVAIPAAYIGNPMAAQLKASAIVSEITAASVGRPLNPANNRYTPQNRFPYTATQRMAGNPPRPDTLVTIAGTNRVMFGPDNTGEALNRIGPQGNGVLTAMAFGGSGTATGLDASGASSMVDAGIDGEFVAVVTPSPNESFLAVLDQLAVELDDNSIPVTVDPLTDELTLDDPLTATQGFDFGDTDTGFSDFAVASEIPEPATASLLGCAAIVVVALGRGRGGRISLRRRLNR
jgi:hypothetical protein